MLFGMKAIVAGGTALLELTKETFSNLRMKRREIDMMLLHAEDQLEKYGVPQIDFVQYNEDEENADELKLNNPKLFRLKKF